jgi:multidrug efflux system membrane fusion protein
MRNKAIMVAAAAIIACGLAGWSWWSPSRTIATTPPPPVPVVAALAMRADVPVYLSSLGTVQAFNTVTIHSRVDGQLEKVAFIEGQDVHAGDLLAQLDARPFQAALDQAVATKEHDEANLANSQLNLGRYVKLGQYATQQTVDSQRASVAEIQAQLHSDQAAIDNARTQLSYTTIVSPIDGRTGMRLVDQGNIVHASDPTGLVIITQLQPISLILTVPEDQLPALVRSMAEGPMTVQALSRDEKTVLDTGTVALIDNQIDQSTGTARLKATFPNRDHLLWPGQFIVARLLLRTERQVLTVPAGAIQRGAQGLFVFVVAPGDTIEVRPLKVGVLTSEVAVVEAGLQPGERVVTAGEYRLAPGTRVVVREAAPSSVAPSSAANASAAASSAAATPAAATGAAAASVQQPAP